MHWKRAQDRLFQSTLPVWGATCRGRFPLRRKGISIHAPRVGSDWHRVAMSVTSGKFQSTLPVWGATGVGPSGPGRSKFQSTLPVWGATAGGQVAAAVVKLISIHAPRVGSDAPPPVKWSLSKFQSTLPVWGATHCSAGRTAPAGISIHAPRVGSDARTAMYTARARNFNPRSPCGERRPKIPTTPPIKRFQSTLPVWGATAPPSPLFWMFLHFNPRSPCGERLSRRPPGWRETGISIHAPRVGSDPAPLWRRGYKLISIHAPRVGSDRRSGASANPASQFQSTLPVWGATEQSPTLAAAPSDFNPRSPCGERLRSCTYTSRWPIISIHAPRVGSDLEYLPPGRAVSEISIHAPRVGSDNGAAQADQDRAISIHAPRVGSDLDRGRLPPVERDFNPRSPCGERLPSSVFDNPALLFQSTLPVWGATDI